MGDIFEKEDGVPEYPGTFYVDFKWVFTSIGPTTTDVEWTCAIGSEEEGILGTGVAETQFGSLLGAVNNYKMRHCNKEGDKESIGRKHKRLMEVKE